MSGANGGNGPDLRPAQTVFAELGPDAGPGTRVIAAWFAALSEGRGDDAWALMDPAGPYFLLRQRTTVTNAEFGRIMTGLVGTTFSRPIAWSLGAMTEQDDRVSAIAAGEVPLVAGGTYDNLYHFLFRVEGGLIREGYEFGDTFRSAQVFAKPPGEA